MKWMYATLLSAVMFAGFPVAPLLAEIDGREGVWACSQADGSTVYTNKERAGCEALMLKSVSVVPDITLMPTIPRTMTEAIPPVDARRSPGRVPPLGHRSVPDWARDWYSSIAPSGSVQEEVCSLYSEWMHLVQKTRGGLFFGSDPSYGGDLTGRNQRGASYSYFDNTRYLTLSRLFGRGFVPVGCY